MYAKVKISGNLEVKTGMHIGGASAFSAIGAVDSPVIRDVLSNLPMIPGTSLKGKMRTLLAKSYNRDMKVSPDDDDPRLIAWMNAKSLSRTLVMFEIAKGIENQKASKESREGESLSA